MLRCRDMSELVTDYLKHELPVRRRFGVWLHLRLCEACRRYTDQMRETVARALPAAAGEPAKRGGGEVDCGGPAASMNGAGGNRAASNCRFAGQLMPPGAGMSQAAWKSATLIEI